MQNLLFRVAHSGLDDRLLNFGRIVGKPDKNPFGDYFWVCRSIAKNSDTYSLSLDLKSQGLSRFRNKG